MTDKARLRVFCIAGPLFLGLYCYSILNLPSWGEYRGPYGDMISRLAVYERHATDAVNAVNYDYRGFDTLGEEFILFTAVLGVMMLLRRDQDVPAKSVGNLADRPQLSVSLQTTIPIVLLVTILFGIYIGLHGQLTPGGGFQAGVILSSALLLVYIAENTEAFKRITSHAAVEVIEAFGASAYALIGFVPLLAGLPFLTDILPLGTTGDVFSAGNISLISFCVGIEVTAAFLVVVYSFLEEIVTGQIPED